MKITMNKIKEKVSINSIMEKYERHMVLNNFSQETIKLVKVIFNNFLLFLNDDNFLITNLDNEIIENYIMWLKEQENKNTTINIKLGSMRMFLYWAMKKEYCNEFKICLVKADKTIRKVYSENELNALLEKPNISKCLFSYYRDWVIVNFLLSTGARSNTLINIKIEHIDFDNNLIRFLITKNKTPQIVPMSINLAEILKEYLTYREGDSDDYLFCNVKGKQLTRNVLKDAIRRYNLKHGVALTSLHSYRHTFAKMFITNGGNLFVLQNLMAHSSIRKHKYM